MKEFTKNFEEKLKSCTGVYIFIHTSPDLDCVASAISMSYALFKCNVKSVILTDNMKRVKTLYKKITTSLDDDKLEYEIVDAVHEDNKIDFRQYQVLVSDVIRHFSFLGKEPIILFCDCRPARAGKYVLQLPYSLISDYYTKDNTLVIDHHVPEGEEGELLLIDENMSSASEMCSNVIENVLKVECDKFLANVIFSGIAFDTSMFRYSTADNASETFALCSRLVRFGISPNLVYAAISYGKAVSYNLYLSELLKRVQYCKEKKIALVLDDRELERKYSGGNRPSEDLFNILRNTYNVDVVIFLRQDRDPEFVIGSVRVGAFSSFDANELCKNFEGGGGHSKAAAFRIQAPLDRTFEKIKSLVGFIEDKD